MSTGHIDTALPRGATRRRTVRLPGQAYALTVVTARREPLLEDLLTARTVVRVMRDMEEDGLLRSMAWVVMPDHLHWLVQLEHPAQPQSILQRFRDQSRLAVGRHVPDAGELWSHEAEVRALGDDEDIREVSRHIVTNPLRWGLARSLGEYPHWDAIWL